MATWELTSEWKKSAVERQFWYKDDKVIIREEGYRWGTFTVESDTMPLTYEELRNEDGYELGSIDNDECWELVDMIDGCWADTEKGRNCTDEDLEEFEEAWEEDYYEGVEAKGWTQDDTEYFFTSGALKLTNLDTGEEFSGSVDPATIVHTIDLTEAITVEVAPELSPILNEEAKWPFFTDVLAAIEEESVLTDWFPADIDPVRKGEYQVIFDKEEVKWPFESNVHAAEWDGKKWDVPAAKKVVQWRGLAKDPAL